MSSYTIRLSNLLQSSQKTLKSNLTRSFSITVTRYNKKEMKLGFLGTGRIAQAIMIGLIRKNKLKPEQIYASDANRDYIKYLKEKCPTFRVSKHL